MIPQFFPLLFLHSLLHYSSLPTVQPTCIMWLKKRSTTSNHQQEALDDKTSSKHLFFLMVKKVSLVLEKIKIKVNEVKLY